MQINIVARHLELTPAIAEYVKKKVEKCSKYTNNVVWIQVVLSVEKYRQLCEIILHAEKTTYRSKQESTDLYAAIDMSVDRMEKQLKKFKEMYKVHRKSKNQEQPTRKPQKTSKPISLSNQKSGDHLISEIKRFDIKPLSLDEAIDEMELLGFNFYMFMNAESSQLNVIYRKENGTFGLLEPEI
jgi:putative sigma-54 modulation protein